MTLPAFETLLTEVTDDGIAVVTMNRPEKLNALDATMFRELRELAIALDAERDVRAVVLTGAGRGFCAGADLAAIAGLPSDTVPDFWRFQTAGGEMTIAWKRIGKPVIASVHGPAAGGGLALALACDVRVAGPLARFNVAFVKLGLSGCDVGVSWLLPRVVGLGNASELMLTGRLIDAGEALRIGLVNRIADDPLEAALELARETAANSPFGLRLTKQGLELAMDAPSLEAAVAIENRNQVLASRTEDMAEAVAAFLAKRPAQFQER